MANPNLFNATSVQGLQNGNTLTSTSATTILSNSASSGKLVILKSLYLTNMDSSAGSAHTIDLTLNDGASTGNITNDLSIPVATTVQVVDKPIYLQENSILNAIPSSANKIGYVISFQEIS
jgi:hypothetical protein